MIYENFAGTYGGGIAGDYGQSVVIENNLIHSNEAELGGGIGLNNRCSPMEIRNNTVVNNTASVGGGALWCLDSQLGSEVVVQNSILWGNSAPVGKELYLAHQYDPAVMTISYSDVEGGLASSFLEPGCTLNWGSGMIDLDPLFVAGPSGAFYLSQILAGQGADSPCVDSGEPTTPMLSGTTRTDGVPDGPPVDMGYHYDTD